MGSKWRRGCGTFSHSSLNYSRKQQNLKITRSSVTVTFLDGVQKKVIFCLLSDILTSDVFSHPRFDVQFVMAANTNGVNAQNSVHI